MIIQYKQTDKSLSVMWVLFDIEYFGYMTEKDLKIMKGGNTA